MLLDAGRRAAMVTGLSSWSPTRTTTHAASRSRRAGPSAGPHPERRMAAPAEAAPLQRADALGREAVGRRRPAGAILESSWPSASSNGMVSRGPSFDRHAGRAARNRAIISRIDEHRLGEVGALRPERRASASLFRIEAPARRQHALQACSSGRTYAPSVRARKAVGSMRRPPFSGNGSPSCSRSRASRWLTADWVRPSRIAARLTPRSTISTSSTISRLRSKWRNRSGS